MAMHFFTFTATESRAVRRQLALCCLLTTVATVALASPDDDEVIEAPAAVAQPIFVLSAQQFDQWVFAPTGNSEEAIKQLESQLSLRIEAMDRLSKLTDAQKRKLQLAGMSDIKRLSDNYESLKQKLVNTQYSQNDVSKAYNELRPLQQQWRFGVLGSESLFNKVLRRTLDPQQSEEGERAEQERIRFQYRAKVQLAIGAMENSMPLTAAQRKDIERLLLEETRPPKSFGQYDVYVVLFQASKLPEKKLRAIFDEPQMRALQQMFQQNAQLEQALRQEGLLSD
jgi:hypothetical protein